MVDKKRFRNYGLWLAVSALFVDLAIYAGIIPASESQAITAFAQRGLEVLVLLGIISNPTNPNGKGFNL